MFILDTAGVITLHNIRYNVSDIIYDFSHF